MIYEARANFADKRPLHVYTEEQLKNSYNRGQRSHIREVLGQEKTRYGFYWRLVDEEATESGHEEAIESGDEEATESGHPIENDYYDSCWEIACKKSTKSGEILTSNIPYIREDMVDLDEWSKYLILALKPEFDRMGGEWFISGKTLREAVSEEGIEDMKRCHDIEGYHVYDTYEEARAKDAAKAPPNYYKLGWELRNLLVRYDVDSEGNAYSFDKYWQRCNLDKDKKLS